MKAERRIKEDDLQLFKNVAKVQHAIDRVEGKKVLMYGGGVHTYYLLTCCDFEGQEIRICDKYENGKIENYAIEKPEKAMYDWADKIIISGFSRRNEIYDLLKTQVEDEKIVRLYGDEDDKPFYEIQIEIKMDADKMEDIFRLESECKSKYACWQRKGAGVDYEKSVEKDFFDAVVKDYYLKYIMAGDNVLDIGAGTGRLSMEAFRVGANVTAVDTSKDMLAVINKKEKRINTVVVQDEKLPFDDESFDKVISCEVMVHFVNWKNFLKEHCRVVKNGGYIVHAMRNDGHLREISDERIIRASYITGARDYYATVTRKELEDACDEIGGLKLVEMIPYNFFAQTAFSYGLLTRTEMMELQRYYNSLCGNPKAREVIKKFENEIVSKLPEYMATSNICVFRKNNGTQDS